MNSKVRSKYLRLIANFGAAILSMTAVIVQAISSTADFIQILLSGLGIVVIVLLVLVNIAVHIYISKTEDSTDVSVEVRSSKGRIRSRKEEKKQSQLYRGLSIALFGVLVLESAVSLIVLQRNDQLQLLNRVVDEMNQAAQEKQKQSAKPLYVPPPPPAGSKIKMWESFDLLPTGEYSLPSAFLPKAVGDVRINAGEQFSGFLYDSQSTKIALDPADQNNKVWLVEPNADGGVVTMLYPGIDTNFTLRYRVKGATALNVERGIFSDFEDGEWHTFDQVVKDGRVSKYKDGILVESSEDTANLHIMVSLFRGIVMFDDIVWWEG